MKVYGYKKCSTCRNAQKFLDQKKLVYQFIDYTEQPLSKEELRAILAKGTFTIDRLFNTSGNVYRELHLKDQMAFLSEEQKLTLLSEYPMLIKRPILVMGAKALVGFKSAQWEEQLK